MAIIPGVTVDYTLSPRIIAVPVAGSSVVVTIEDLQDTLLDLEDDEDGGIVYPRLRDCTGGNALGGGRFTGYTMTLQNAQVMFQGQTAADAEGTASANDPNGKILTDATATFITTGVERGAKVFNWSTCAMSVVTEVVSETQLRHLALSGGSRATWIAGDAYRLYSTAKCTLTGGNLTALDAYGADLDPVMKSSNVYVQMESSTSAALIGMASVAAECAAAVMDEPIGGHIVPGSLPVAIRQIQGLTAKAAV